MRVDIIAVGKIAKSPFTELIETYRKRMQWGVDIIEIQSHASTTNAQENALILAAIEKKSSKECRIIALDERGKNVSSTEFADNINRWSVNGCSHIIVLIGGADGLNDEIRNKAHLLLSFGKLTWPHKLVRVLLCEQLYRAQQIIAGHPYHRE